MMGNNKEVRLKFVHCTDIHGNYFPYDFIRDRSGNASIGSLCRLHTYVTEQREKYKDALVLLDGGDMLQGQPSAYFYNVVDTIDKQCIIVTKDLLNIDKTTGQKALDFDTINKLSCSVYRIEKAEPFNDKDLSTIQTVVKPIR